MSAGQRKPALSVCCRQHQSGRQAFIYTVRNREIWGKLDPYHKVWRIGANDATIFYSELDILFFDSLRLPKGKYSLFAIPRPNEWTIIFSRDWDQWGAYNYDEKDDQLRFDITPNWVKDHRERLTFDIEPDSLGFHWEYLQLNIPFSTR